MIRNVQDLAYASGAVSAGLSNAFLATPNLEGFDATVLDNRAAGSTAVGPGKLFVEQFLAANTGDANYTLSATATQPLPLFSYGVITSLPVPGAPAYGTALVTNTTTGGGTEIRIRQKGTCLAYCTTGGTAIAVGTALAADGAGNLIPNPGVVAGTTLAISKGTLAGGTATPTLVLVNVGGY